jgi:hypothetical protein
MRRFCACRGGRPKDLLYFQYAQNSRYFASLRMTPRRIVLLLEEFQNRRLKRVGAAELRSNRKGCDIGYGLAANSCEGVNSVDACTVTALDAITAFAVPNPGGILAEQSVFSGLVARRVASMSGSLSLLQISDLLRSQPFSTVDIRDTST